MILVLLFACPYVNLFLHVSVYQPVCQGEPIRLFV